MTEMFDAGWEADRLYRNVVTAERALPNRPIVITGYQFKLAMEPSDKQVSSEIVNVVDSAQVLWQCRIGGLPTNDNGGPLILTDKTGTHQNLHGSASIGNMLADSILKASPWTNSVNDVVEITGLHIEVPAGCSVNFFAGHAGCGPIDFECQGEIYFE